jgi:hypothetical protein
MKKILILCVLFISAIILYAKLDNLAEVESKYQNYYCSYCGKELRISRIKWCPPPWMSFVCSDMCETYTTEGEISRRIVGVVTRYDESNWFITAFEFYPDSETGDYIQMNANVKETMLSLNKARTMFSHPSVFDVGKTIHLNSYVTGPIDLICDIDDNGKYFKYVKNDTVIFKLYEYQILDTLKVVVKEYNDNYGNSNRPYSFSSSGIASSHHSRMVRGINNRRMGLPW